MRPILDSDALVNTPHRMRDPRIDAYAELLVGRCVAVQPGWEVVIRATTLARPLIEAVIEEIAHRGAHPLLQLGFETIGGPFAREAPVDVLREAAPLQRRIWDECDAMITISSPESAREGSDLSDERRRALDQRWAPLRRRTMAREIPWVICEYPVQATADEAGMSLFELEEFVFGAVLLDWDAEAAKMRRIADVFDAVSDVRVVGEGTDITLSLAGRTGEIDDGRVNMPGGEVFYSPVEDSAEGEITFSEFPAIRFGNEVTGARLVFQGGSVVEATAATGEAFLIEALDTDEGSRRLGELGIGCNPRIERFMRHLAYDEKIAGTIHLALGNSYSFTGGTNVSAIHWDMVKDLRSGGSLYADGKLVQENGRWLL
jgi:aminopeptidase